MTIEESEIACSSFTAKTEDDHYLFARNYDFDKTNTMIVYTQADGDRHATISTVDLQFLGIDKDAGIATLMDKITSLAATFTPLDGINDKGVAVGIYMTYQGLDTVPTDQNTAKPDITSTTLLRLILDYADDLDEAIEIAKAYDMHDSAMTSYHYMVADSSGRSAILEYVGTNDREDNDSTKRELVITYSDDDARIGKIEADADYQVVTNFIIQPDYYQDEDQSEKKGFDRYERIYQELSKTNGILKSDQEAMDILKIVGRRLWDNDDQNGLTVHSVVYDLSAKKALWVSNENFDDPGAIFELSFE